MVYYFVFKGDWEIGRTSDFLSARRIAAQFSHDPKHKVIHIYRQNKYRFNLKDITGHWTIQWLKYPDDRKRLYLHDEFDYSDNLRVLTDYGYYWNKKR